MSTAELSGRPAGRQRHKEENRILGALTCTLGLDPGSVFAQLAPSILELTGCESAGVSILQKQDDSPLLRWQVTAGAYLSLAGVALPRHASPCGVAMDQQSPQLFKSPAQHFPCIAHLQPSIAEQLIAPFNQSNGQPVGAIWGMYHTPGKQFHPQDARLLGRLSQLAAAAVQCMTNQELVKIANKALQNEARNREQAELERAGSLRAERQARAQAEEASVAKTRFLAILSHELRTPLTPVLTTLQMLESEQGLSEDLRERVVMMRRNVELEARLVDDMLDLTRVIQGKLELQFVVVDLHEKIHHVLDICTADARSKHVEVTLDLQAQQHHARCDGARVQQILWNLLKNAIKFTPSGGQIRLSSRDAPDGRIALAVSDTGIGMESDALSRIFDPFEQGGREITRLFGGLGLGLSISRALADMHGGTLTAASSGKSLGSTFTLILPTAPAPNITHDPAKPGCARNLECRILLVEDHPDTARAMARLLKTGTCAVRLAGSIAEALKEVDAAHFDLVISDIGLPDGSGLDLMRQLRHRQPDLKGIALSGYAMPEDVQQSFASGFGIHLTKPVDLQRLKDAVSKMLS